MEGKGPEAGWSKAPALGLPSRFSTSAGSVCACIGGQTPAGVDCNTHADAVLCSRCVRKTWTFENISASSVDHLRAESKN